MKNLGLFVPAIAPIAIQLIFLVLAYAVFPISIFFVYLAPNPYLIWAGSFIASIVGFIAGCMVVDMANDVINGRPMNLNKSMKLVTGKLGTLILAAIVSAICAITIVLLPVALFIITIAVLEGTDAIESTKRSFNFVVQNVGEVIIYIIVVIVVSAILGFGFGYIPVVGPYLGAILNWILNVVFSVSAVYFYLSLRRTLLPPPPPPPPPV
jgi:F0F1-type ATP synthase assembly protein I